MLFLYSGKAYRGNIYQFQYFHHDCMIKDIYYELLWIILTLLHHPILRKFEFY